MDFKDKMESEDEIDSLQRILGDPEMGPIAEELLATICSDRYDFEIDPT